MLFRRRRIGHERKNKFETRLYRGVGSSNHCTVKSGQGQGQSAAEYSVPWQVVAGMKCRARGKVSEVSKKKVSASTIIGEQPESTEGAVMLVIKNAMLRERTIKLEAQLEKLKMAIQGLM